MGFLHADGTFQKYGTEKAVANRGGEYTTYGALRTIEIKIDLTTLNQNEVIQSDVTFFPAGVRIEEVVMTVQTAAATGVAVDVGLTRTDRSTEIDFDGILAAMPTATMTAGNKVTLVKGGTNVGALVGSGTSIANIGYISASATTATAFTAGVIILEIKYFTPIS